MSDATLLPPSALPIPRVLERASMRAWAMEAANAGLWNPQACPLSVLPWLAWAFAVDVWDSGWTEARKRQVVAASLEVHRRKGTRAALELGLAAVDHVTQVVEWWEANPKAAPYTFRVLVNCDAGADLADLRTITAVIASAKNLRSWLSGLTLTSSHAGAVRVAGAARARMAIHLPARAA